MSVLANMSPEVSAVVLPLVGFIAKMLLDSVIGIFKSTISTPARVKKLEDDLKAANDKLAVLERDLGTNWSKYEEVDRKLFELKHEIDGE